MQAFSGIVVLTLVSSFSILIDQQGRSTASPTGDAFIQQKMELKILLKKTSDEYKEKFEYYTPKNVTGGCKIPALECFRDQMKNAKSYFGMAEEFYMIEGLVNAIISRLQEIKKHQESTCTPCEEYDKKPFKNYIESFINEIQKE